MSLTEAVLTSLGGSVVSYRRFGTAYQSHINRQAFQEDGFYLNFFVSKILICYLLSRIIEH